MTIEVVDPFELLARSFETRTEYGTRPVEWVHERIKEVAWSKQQQIMNSLVTDRMVAVPSCHGVGKSHIASRAAAWWVDAHGNEPDEVFLVTTAPTASQVVTVLWRYIKQVHRKPVKPALPGTVVSSPNPTWKIAGIEVGVGRKPSDHDDSTFQGLHAKYILIIIDEACGVLPGIWDQLASLASNDNARILAIGNPTDPSSFFFQICKDSSDYTVIRIDALETPGFSEERTRDYPLTRLLMEAEGIPFSEEVIPDSLYEDLVSPKYCEERIRAYCGFSREAHLTTEREELKSELVQKTRQSPMFQARIRGVFPTDATTGVIPMGWVQAAINRYAAWQDAGRPELPGRRVVGVDVARFGEDETVLAVRQGHAVERIITYAKQDTMETADQVQPWLNHPQSLAVIDVNGLGAGVFDRLRRDKKNHLIHGQPLTFNASERTVKKDRTGEFTFMTDRDASWWHLRDLLDPSREGGSNVMLPDDEMLVTELTTVQYKVMPGAVIKVETKDEVRKRIKRSTDRADAVIQSYWVEGLPVIADTSPRTVSSSQGAVQYAGYEPLGRDHFFGPNEWSSEVPGQPSPGGSAGGWSGW